MDSSVGGGRRLTQTLAAELRRHELEKEKLDRKQKLLQKSLSREQLDLSRKLQILSVASASSGGVRRSFNSPATTEDVAGVLDTGPSLPAAAPVNRRLDQCFNFDRQESRGSLPDLNYLGSRIGSARSRHNSIDPSGGVRTRSIDRRESTLSCATALGEALSPPGDDDSPEWRKKLVQKLAQKDSRSDRNQERAEISAMLSGCPLANKNMTTNSGDGVGGKHRGERAPPGYLSATASSKARLGSISSASTDHRRSQQFGGAGAFTVVERGESPAP